MFALFFACLAPRRWVNCPTRTRAARYSSRAVKKQREGCAHTSSARSVKSAAHQSSFSPSYVVTDTMPVRSGYMHPLDFLSSSDPLLLTPEEKAAENAEKERVQALQKDAQALAAAFARELEKKRMRTMPAEAVRASRAAVVPATPMSPNPRRGATQRPRPCPSTRPSRKAVPEAPRKRKSQIKTHKVKRVKVKKLKRRQKLTARNTTVIRTTRGRGRPPKAPIAASKKIPKSRQTSRRRTSRPRPRRTAAKRLRTAAAAALRHGATSGKRTFSTGRKKRTAVPSRRGYSTGQAMIMTALSKGVVEAWRQEKPKKRAMVSAHHGKRTHKI